jgi:hypothetical protein
MSEDIVTNITDTLEALANGEETEHHGDLPEDRDWLEIQLGAFFFLNGPIRPLPEVQITGPDLRDTL